MKKILKNIGLATTIILSFIISEKTALAVKEVDEIMSEIKLRQDKYKIEPQDALIEKNTIIPGLNGKQVNIEKSYQEMKKIGTFNDKYIIYNEIRPTITINNQYDKYIISGNPKKNTVSIIFKVYDNDNIDKVLTILEKNKVKANFFIDVKWLENNNENVTKLIKKGYIIGNLGKNLEYKNVEFIWMNNIINTIGKQKTNYCYSEIESIENLKECTQQKNYTIMPNIIIKKQPLIEIKKEIESGSIIALPVNETVEKELELIIKYIKSKGLKIETLPIHLSEKNN